jgi:hypothetical protein
VSVGRAIERKLKFILPGLMAIVDTIADTYYGDRVNMSMAFAKNEEARALETLNERKSSAREFLVLGCYACKE